MPITRVVVREVAQDGAAEVICPYTGAVVADEDNVIPSSTLLFASHGGDGYAYLRRDLATLAEFRPAALIRMVGAKDATLLVVNTGWNGVNFYGFIPSRARKPKQTKRADSSKKKARARKAKARRV